LFCANVKARQGAGTAFGRTRFEIGGKRDTKLRAREHEQILQVGGFEPVGNVVEPGITGADHEGNAIECPANPPLLLP
jgi:hypothetical protein